MDDDDVRRRMEELSREIERAVCEGLIGDVQQDRSAMLDHIQRTMMALSGQPCIARWSPDGQIVLTGPVFHYEVIYG